MKKNHDLYAARINGMYICKGSTKGNPVLSAKTKDAMKFPDYVIARMQGVQLGATDTVSLDRHGLVGIVDVLG
jgi:hypothetical protein